MAFAAIPNVSSIGLSYTGLVNMPPLTPLKRNLENLFLGFNSIAFVPQSYFLGFKKLGVLDMRHNILHVIPDISPLRNTLQMICLTKNKLRSMSDGFTLVVFLELGAIHLEDNIIQEFDSSMLPFWPILHLLDLRYNRIVNLPASYPMDDYRNCSECDRIVFVFMGNPIHCGPPVEDIISRRINDNNYVNLNSYIMITNLHFTKCASPSYLCGRDLSTLGKWNGIAITNTILCYAYHPIKDTCTFVLFCCGCVICN